MDKFEDIALSIILGGFCLAVAVNVIEVIVKLF